MTIQSAASIRPPLLGSISARLVLLTLLLLVPAALVTALLLWRAYEYEHGAAERQLSDTARALSQVVDREVGQARILLEALSTSIMLHEGDLAGFDRQARAASPDRSRWVVVTDQQGRQIVNTGRPAGSSLPAGILSDRAPGYRVLPGGIRLWNLVIGPATRAPVMVLSRQIPLQNGSVVELGVQVQAGAFVRIFEEQGFADRWTGALADGRGIVIARSRGQERYVGTLASADMRRRIAESSQAVAASRTLDGIPSITAHVTSPLTRWTMVVAAPREALAAGARYSLIIGALLGVSLLGLGLVGAVYVGRHIARPVRRLASAAEALGHGERPPLAPTGLREVDDVQTALDAAAAELVARERALRDLNDTLELRVVERTAELAEATESLIQAQKMEAVGRLTGGIAHDFNNLLTAVLGNIELVERRNTDPKIARQLHGARTAAERGAKLTGQLLAFARRQQLKTERIDVNTSVENTIDLLESTLGGAIRVERELAADLWPAEADSTQLDLVLLNLAINARDAMPTGGVLAISTTNATLTDNARNPEQPGPGDYVSIIVADTGTGMPPEVLARVFEPFFTTKPTGQGTGLGLSQVLGVLKQLGGGLDIESRVGEGTTITVYLPRAHAAAAPVDTRTVETRDLRGLRVLVIDDDPDVRGVAVALLRDLGCLVSEAASGRAGIAKLADDVACDLVLLDYAMPGLSGTETAARLQAARPELPILLMSGYADAEVLSTSWTGPVLPKPFSAQALIARASEVLRTNRVVRLRGAG